MVKKKEQTPADRLQHIREHILHYTKAQMSAALDGIASSHYSRIERGDVDLAPDKALILVDKWGINLHWYYTGQGSPRIDTQQTDTLAQDTRAFVVQQLAAAKTPSPAMLLTANKIIAFIDKLK